MAIILNYNIICIFTTNTYRPMVVKLFLNLQWRSIGSFYNYYCSVWSNLLDLQQMGSDLDQASFFDFQGSCYFEKGSWDCAKILDVEIVIIRCDLSMKAGNFYFWNDYIILVISSYFSSITRNVYMICVQTAYLFEKQLKIAIQFLNFGWLVSFDSLVFTLLQSWISTSEFRLGYKFEWFVVSLFGIYILLIFSQSAFYP